MIDDLAPISPAAEPSPVAAAEPAPASVAPHPAPEPVASPEPHHPAEVPTLLEGFVKPGTEPPAKPAVAAVDAIKPVEETKPPVVEPVVEPVVAATIEYKFEMPEVIKDSPKEMAEFTGFLNEAKATPEIGQKMLNLHAAAMQKYADGILSRQISSFNSTRSDWAKQVMADEQIGGAGHNTAMGAIARMRDLLVSDSSPGSEQYAADMAAFNEMARVTGVGDHPVFLKMLHRNARYMDAPAPPPPNPKPPPGLGGKPSQGLAGIYK